MASDNNTEPLDLSAFALDSQLRMNDLRQSILDEAGELSRHMTVTKQWAKCQSLDVVQSVVRPVKFSLSRLLSPHSKKAESLRTVAQIGSQRGLQISQAFNIWVVWSSDNTNSTLLVQKSTSHPSFTGQVVYVPTRLEDLSSSELSRLHQDLLQRTTPPADD